MDEWRGSLVAHQLLLLFSVHGLQDGQSFLVVAFPEAL